MLRLALFAGTRTATAVLTAAFAVALQGCDGAGKAAPAAEPLQTPPRAATVTTPPALAPPAQGTGPASPPAAGLPPSAAPPEAGADDRVVITTERGRILIDLFEEDAPRHAENFKKLARQGFYDGLTFHRVVEGFMAQGGDPENTGAGGPGYTLAAEIRRKHARGSVAAARRGNAVNPAKESSGSQFYICLAAQPGLDGEYTVFGQVVEGMDVADRLKRGAGANGSMVPAGSGDRMLKVEVIPAGAK